MQAFLHTKAARPDGTFDSMQTAEVPIKAAILPWQKQGLSFTATGYGARIPTVYMIEVHGRWRRVYAICYSNVSTLFIGKKYDQTAIVDINL